MSNSAPWFSQNGARFRSGGSHRENSSPSLRTTAAPSFDSGFESVSRASSSVFTGDTGSISSAGGAIPNWDWSTQKFYDLESLRRDSQRSISVSQEHSQEDQQSQQSFFLSSLKFGASVQEVSNILPAASEEARILEYRRKKRERRRLQKQHQLEERQALVFQKVMKELDHVLEQEDPKTDLAEREASDNESTYMMFESMAELNKKNYKVNSLYKY